jgi:hypothetical protein
MNIILFIVQLYVNDCRLYSQATYGPLITSDELTTRLRDYQVRVFCVIEIDIELISFL